METEIKDKTIQRITNVLLRAGFKCIQNSKKQMGFYKKNLEIEVNKK